MIGVLGFACCSKILPTGKMQATLAPCPQKEGKETAWRSKARRRGDSRPWGSGHTGHGAGPGDNRMSDLLTPNRGPQVGRTAEPDSEEDEDGALCCGPLRPFPAWNRGSPQGQPDPEEWPLGVPSRRAGDSPVKSPCTPARHRQTGTSSRDPKAGQRWGSGSCRTPVSWGRAGFS